MLPKLDVYELTKYNIGRGRNIFLQNGHRRQNNGS